MLQILNMFDVPLHLPHLLKIVLPKMFRKEEYFYTPTIQIDTLSCLFPFRSSISLEIFICKRKENHISSTLWSIRYKSSFLRSGGSIVKIRPSIGFPSTYLGMYDSPFTRFVQKNEPNRLKVSSIRFDPFILKVEFVLYIFCFNVPEFIYIDSKVLGREQHI